MIIWKIIRILIMVGIGVLIGTAVTANADAAPIVVGHRGASTSTIPENTLQAMKYAVPYAKLLEGDVRWTKDSNDPDTVGTMVVFHDATLDRTTNCSGNVASTLWVKIRDNCRTTINSQRVMKMVDWVAWARSVDKPLVFDMKVADATSAQTKQFWKVAKTAPAGSMVIGTKSVASTTIAKIKKLDAADTGYKLRYGYVSSGSPSAAYVKQTGPYLILEKSASASQVKAYRDAGLDVNLYTGKTQTDYASMVDKNPNRVTVDNAKRYAEWLAAR